MKALASAIRKHRTLLFFDLEATQISHELIEIGAYRVTIRDDFSIKKIFKPYHAYCKPKHRIGHVVSKLTGITEKTIADKGISYREVLNGLQKYLGKEFKDVLLVCYGDQDPRIFQSSMENNLDASRDVSHYLSHHCFNFSAFLSQYIRDENNNVMSLSRMVDHLGLQFEGAAHGALADAKNLLNLYVTFLERPDLVVKDYKLRLTRNPDVPPALRAVATMLNEGKTITPEEYEKIVLETIL